MNLKKDTYRWDIQGLRAIAVLSVVIYHISPNTLPGGYLGVDIFFVISGYLIIGHIYKDLMERKFDLVGFYSRRVKRLFPPLFVMMIFSSVVAYRYLLPSEMQLYAGSVISTLLYVSNLYFYRESDYFSADLEGSLLLHTWSLSVEEQFYLLFPLLMIFVFKVARQYFFIIIFFVLLCSLTLSEILVSYDQSLSFYLSPSRFWQFISGGMVALYSVEKMSSYYKNLLDAGGIVGLLVILVCLYCYSGEVVFPGINAVLPTIAVVLILFSGGVKGFTYSVLSTRVSSFIGKISYSLYLWHWPIIIFYKLEVTSSLDREDKVILLFLSVLFGFLSWYLVEKKVASIHSFSVKKVFLSSSLLSVLYCILATYSSTGLPYRFNSDQLDYASFLDYDSSIFREGSCFISSKYDDAKYFDSDTCIVHKEGKNNILLMGDSHAAHLYTAINHFKGETETVSQVTSSGCKPTVSYIGAGRCTTLNLWSYRELIKEKSFDQIILSARWSEKDVRSLVETVEFLENLVPSIVIMGPSMEYGVSLPRLLTSDIDKYQVAEAIGFSKISKIDKLMKSALSATAATYISMLELNCNKDGNCISITKENIPITFDYGHFTHEGALETLAKIM